ncbi:hypothetical protein SAMN05421805_12763 [Saccharopolyspora antimicrobica]|uniref:Uncharacterized protein n=1 Tax=Saccharopolyspora antimicrobica TaxID=455193 RepID=A0A1I5KLX8_9PSEU|nr:hypothetical protein [Saccharopolyspora antimicrobica]RKT85634.1 hypothetical protein ATL45_3981 [Saccharopolyspora antimicrobica]SFO85666.1 hypothetical protein SAMN05421805_12763 [Saccharopolyspora antimicrobica]
MATTTIQIRSDALKRHRIAAGLTSNYALARAMGLEQSTLSRTLGTGRAPSSLFVAGLLRALQPATFEELFELVELAPTEDAA